MSHMKLTIDLEAGKVRRWFELLVGCLLHGLLPSLNVNMVSVA